MNREIEIEKLRELRIITRRLFFLKFLSHLKHGFYLALTSAFLVNASELEYKNFFISARQKPCLTINNIWKYHKTMFSLFWLTERLFFEKSMNKTFSYSSLQPVSQSTVTREFSHFFPFLIDEESVTRLSSLLLNDIIKLLYISTKRFYAYNILFLINKHYVFLSPLETIFLFTK